MTGASWSSIEKMEQARWMRFAREHADQHGLCLAITVQGHVSQAEAAQLARLAADSGWKIPSVGRAAAKRRRKRRT